MKLLNKTSNPAFTSYFWDNNKDHSNKMTVSGIVVKSFTCIVIIAAIIVGVWRQYTQFNIDLKWFTLGGMLGAIIISIIISVRQHWAHVLVPLYAIAKGFFLAGITVMAHKQFPELPYQAVGVTVVTFIVILLFYQTRIIVVTKQLRSVIITACASIFTVYIVGWILSFFGIRVFIWGTSWLAIGFNCVAAIFAALSLLLDFDYIEHQKHKAPKYNEWLATWGLLVTLVWLYAEILRLMRKLAIRF